jgi:hypothetical protein
MIVPRMKEKKISKEKHSSIVEINELISNDEFIKKIIREYKDKFMNKLGNDSVDESSV